MTSLADQATQARARHDRIVARYNRDYAAGKFTTNRPLAAAAENAYDEMVRLEKAAAAVAEKVKA